jgi:hypothetical protein
MLLGPDQSARGLVQFKTLARKAMALVNAKQSWTAVALHRFSPKTCLPPHLSGNKIAL